MRINFTLEYWLDQSWYVGRLKEVPGVFSQGKSMQELEDNITEAYHLMLVDENELPQHLHRQIKEIGVEV